MNYNDDIEKILAGIDTTKEPPTEEPARQYYFIKKAREIVKKRSEELGRPFLISIFSIITFTNFFNVSLPTIGAKSQSVRRIGSYTIKEIRLQIARKTIPKHH